MPKIQVNDIEMYYELHGTGKPLIFVSGLTLDHSAWLPFTDFFSQHFKVLIFDNRGVGQTSSPDAAYTIEQMADDTMALADALGIDNPHVAGGSMGGAITQMIGLKHGSAVDKLGIFVSTPKFSENCYGFADHITFLMEKGVTTEQLANACFPWIYSTHYLEKKDQVQKSIEQMAANPFPQTLTGYKGQVEALKNFNIKEGVKKIKNKCLVLYAEEDILVLPKETQYLIDNLPHVKGVMIKDSGHSLPFEKPIEFGNALFNFLKQ